MERQNHREAVEEGFMGCRKLMVWEPVGEGDKEEAQWKSLSLQRMCDWSLHTQG